jgi:hypothetical protein
MTELVNEGYCATADLGGMSDYWPDPVDLFAEFPAPAFPLETLPAGIEKFATRHARQTGFDPGAYGFAMLCAAANAIDHRSRLAVTPSFKVPPMLWGGLVDPSGGGKSHILAASTNSSKTLDDRQTVKSSEQRAAWELLPRKEREGKAPPKWHQRLCVDVTVEALTELLGDNPQGVNIYIDELTEFIGRMDAYHNGGGKDRATYLRAFDGGSVNTNRKGAHRHVENFSVGILTGIQPTKLAEIYRRHSGGSDGLYQRFLFYNMAPAGPADYQAAIHPGVIGEQFELIEKLWKRRINTELERAAAAVANEYHNAMRTIAQRTPGARLSEHLNKYPGFINRVAFSLHALEAANGQHGYSDPVTADTWEKARQVMRCIYRHSEAAYARLDDAENRSMRLARSAGEFLLSKKVYDQCRRGDFTRNATGWRDADPKDAEGAVDLLIEFAWLTDITTNDPSRRGRRSDGTYAINNGIHIAFEDHATRVRHARQERYLAIQIAAAERTGGNN